MIPRRIAWRAHVLVLAGAFVMAPPPAVGGQAVTDGPHGPLPDGMECEDCHTTTAWIPLRADPEFDHDTDTEFVLDGRHADARCARCHAGLVFDRIETRIEECATCHVDVHRGAMTRSCTACHSSESFTELDPGLVHPSDFPLEGAHLQTSCESCHTDDLGGAFRALDRECATCHMDEYASTSLVDHRRLGFSTDCVECHSMLDFRDVAFDHFQISGGFELRGAHAGIECTTCHSGADGGIAGSAAGPADCVACHRGEYEREHGGSGFPTDCAACHDGFDWDGADFQHAFSIFSGPHAEEWSACSACHVQPGDYSVFSCVACHGRAETDAHHDEEPGYAYESRLCLQCHPTGRS